MPDPLTARELVVDLERRGAGRWGTAIVRRWIHEEPACPIAEKGRPGQSHRYDPDAVEAWLRERDRRLAFQAGGAGSTLAESANPVPSDDADGMPAQAVEQAEYNETVERLLQILEGRDPRNWKAAEEALMTRMKRLEMLGYTVNVDDMRRCLDAQAQLFKTGMNALRNQLKMAVGESQLRAERESIIDQEIDLMLERIAESVDAAMATGADHAA